MTHEEDISRRLTKKIESMLFDQICGPVRKRPQTALRVRGRSFETVELDDAGNVIEPPAPMLPELWCPACAELQILGHHLSRHGQL